MDPGPNDKPFTLPIVEPFSDMMCLFTKDGGGNMICPTFTFEFSLDHRSRTFLTVQSLGHFCSTADVFFSFLGSQWSYLDKKKLNIYGKTLKPLARQYFMKIFKIKKRKITKLLVMVLGTRN